MVRLFVAIDLPDAIRGHLSVPQEYLKRGCARLTMVDPSLVHVTLKFIGEVDSRREGSICAALSGIRFTPFPLRITGIGSNNPRRPRVIWCTLSDNGECAALHEKVEVALLPLGIPKEERLFRPHATIARVKQSDESLPAMIQAIPREEFGSFMVTGFRLKKSTLTPCGPIYETLMEVPSS